MGLPRSSEREEWTAIKPKLPNRPRGVHDVIRLARLAADANAWAAVASQMRMRQRIAPHHPLIGFYTCVICHVCELHSLDG